jgi:hypothetical protein
MSWTAFVTVTGFFGQHLASPGFDNKSVLYLLGIAWVGSRSGASNNDSSSGPLDVLRRFREAVYRLFGGSAEEEVTPTVLALLVGPARAAGGADPETPQRD